MPCTALFSDLHGLGGNLLSLHGQAEDSDLILMVSPAFAEKNTISFANVFSLFSILLDFSG